MRKITIKGGCSRKECFILSVKSFLKFAFFTSWVFFAFSWYDERDCMASLEHEVQANNVLSHIIEKHLNNQGLTHKH